MSFVGISYADPATAAASFLGLGLLQWTALAAIAGFLLAIAAVVTIIVTVCTTRSARERDDTRRKEDRDRDDARREQDREWDSGRREEDRQHDADLRRQDREREDHLRRKTDETWERRRRAEQRQREDDDAQENVIVEFPPGGPLSQAQRAVTTGDGITHRIIVTTPAAYPIKWLDARIAHRTNSGPGILPPGWSFEQPARENGQVRYVCYAGINPQARDPEPIVRFTDRNSHLYYSYLGYTRRFSQNTDFSEAARQIDQWNRTGPRPEEPGDEA